MTTTSTEIIRKIHSDNTSFELTTHEDHPEFLRLRTTTVTSKSYWGEVDLILPAELAIVLGRALVAAATEQGAA